MKVYYYPKCTTCKKALKWLEEQGKSYEQESFKMAGRTGKEL